MKSELDVYCQHEELKHVIVMKPPYLVVQFGGRSVLDLNLLHPDRNLLSCQAHPEFSVAHRDIEMRVAFDLKRLLFWGGHRPSARRGLRTA